MAKLVSTFSVVLLLVVCQSWAQTANNLRQTIQQLAVAKQATVGVSIVGGHGEDTVSHNGLVRFPMQSVFKFHIALAMLSQIDAGKFSLKQKVKIEKKDLLPNLYSPIREKYPNGAKLPLSTILTYTVASSDNVGCEVLLRLLGGPAVVEAYFVKNDINNVSIKVNEQEQQANWELQFQNWTTPTAATETLRKFYDNTENLLTKRSHNFIWRTMKATKTGVDRLKAQLPNGTIVAHKTGSSGTNKAGVTAAVNDIGIVFLPNGHHFFISVLVTNSTENEATNEKIIADIAKAAWDYFVAKQR